MCRFEQGDSDSDQPSEKEVGGRESVCVCCF